MNTPGALAPKPAAVQQATETAAEADVAVEAAQHSATRLGFVFNFNKKTYPYFSIDTVIGEANEDQNSFAGKVEVLDIAKYIDTTNYDPADVALLNNVRKLQDSELKNISSAIRRLPIRWKSLPSRVSWMRSKKSWRTNICCHGLKNCWQTAEKIRWHLYYRPVKIHNAKPSKR